MSQDLSQPLCCPTDCDPIITQGTPGAPGAAGAPGEDGDPGDNAWTTTTDPFTMPAELGDVSIDVANSDWMTVGQAVFAGKLSSAAKGYFEVVSKASSTEVTLKNLEDTPNSLYPGNSPPGIIFPSLTQISPAGIQGADGTPPAGVLFAANNLADVNNTATSRTNLGLGSVATRTAGNANNNVPFVDDAAGLAAGESLFATATGVESVTAATARTNLGLGTIATQNASAVAITGGAINGTLGDTTPSTAVVTSFIASGAATFNGNVTHASRHFQTPSALQSLAAANVIAATASKIRVVGSGAPVTMTSTPTITNGVADGQRLLIKGTDAVNTVTLQNETGLAGSTLRLSAATRVLGAFSQIELSWDATSGMWCEISFSAN